MTEELNRRLTEAQEELKEAREQGKRREPMIKRLERHVRDNSFADRIIEMMEESLRRP